MVGRELHGDERAIQGTSGLTEGMSKGRENVQQVHSRVRQAILCNEIPANTTISQVRLAETLGVSRTPLREALRLLEHEGLVEYEVNRRARVADVTVEDLEGLYAIRIQLETLGAYITTGRLTDVDLGELESHFDLMQHFAEQRNYEDWQQPHRDFHRVLIQHSGERMVASIQQYSDHAERYRHIYLSEADQSWSNSVEEHRAIYEACISRKPAEVANLLAKHYSAIVLGILSKRDPGYDPLAVRTAWRMAKQLGEA